MKQTITYTDLSIADVLNFLYTVRTVWTIKVENREVELHTSEPFYIKNSFGTINLYKIVEDCAFSHDKKQNPDGLWKRFEHKLPLCTIGFDTECRVLSMSYTEDI